MTGTSKEVGPLTASSRGRSTPLIKPSELESLRVKTWFATALADAGLPDGSSNSFRAWFVGSDQDLPIPAALLQTMIHEHGDRLADLYKDCLNDIRRQNYETGQQSPNDLTLQSMNALFPGTQGVYEHGPNDEPLWMVLSGDAKTCEDYLHALMPPPKGQFGLSFEMKIQGLFDGLLAPQWRVNLDAVPIGQQGFGHPVWLSYIHTRFDAAQPQYDRPSENSSQLLEIATIDDLIIGTIAAWWLAVQRQEGPILQLEWLLMGLCQGVIGQVLSPDIQMYVVALVREQTIAIDKVLSKANHPTPNFEQRWTARVDIAPQLNKAE